MTELVERHLLGVGLEYLDTFPVVVIEGARQVGKSPLAQQLLQVRPGIQVTLDVPAQLAAALEDPEAFLRQGGEGTLAIDEAQLTPGQLEPITADVLGGHFKAFLATELLKQQSWSTEQFRLFHYRDRTGIEVDLVAELADGSAVGIEVKTSSSHRPEHFKGLRFLRDRLGSRFRCGVVLGMFQQGFQISDRLIGLPASALWELPAPDQR
ncbi:MAG: DUF4143 domain-containing protein [Arachnia propionica]|uniref:DUF4143 domain-containing protein n=1 Tax=Arachnia propionica TaxID=1750 RepID=UPI0027086C2E|nr:DUF4143 domain-containing protein [Arachnia propionica]